MRTIKFRGKRLDNRKWVYGSLAIDDYGNCQIIGFVDHHEQWYEVEPDTIGQYTGQKDRDGTEIYEGDILSIKFCAGITVPMYVSFIDGGWHIQEHLDYDEYHYLDDYKDNATIIDNIHDNPELLKGGNE